MVKEIWCFIDDAYICRCTPHNLAQKTDEGCQKRDGSNIPALRKYPAAPCEATYNDPDGLGTSSAWFAGRPLVKEITLEEPGTGGTDAIGKGVE